MAVLEVVGAELWYETIRMADDVTLVHEPWIKPFFRCNMWHVRGRDRDLLFDSGPPRPGSLPTRGTSGRSPTATPPTRYSIAYRRAGMLPPTPSRPPRRGGSSMRETSSTSATAPSR